MKTIAIEINDVLRDFSKNFLKYYKKHYDRKHNIQPDQEKLASLLELHESGKLSEEKLEAKIEELEAETGFQINDIKLTTVNYKELVKFDDEEEYNTFVYDDYPFELFALAEPMLGNFHYLTNWLNVVIPEIKEELKLEEEIRVILYSPMEHMRTIHSTLNFLSARGCKARYYVFPESSDEILDQCDVLVSAHPYILDKAKGRVKTVKVTMPYNENVEADITIPHIADLFSENNTKLIIQ